MNASYTSEETVLRLDNGGQPGARIDLGLYPVRTPRENVRLASLAEGLGYSTVWVPDSPVLWREMWVNMTAMAVATSRIRLGSAVTSGVTRHPSVTTSASLSLAELSGGRFALGLGNGDSSLVTSGSGKPQTIAEFRETLIAFRNLLAGRNAKVGEKDLRLPWAGASKVPVLVAATGPRMLELAGEVADGVIIMVGVAEPMVRAALDRIYAGAERAGRDPKSIEIVLWTACAVSDTDPEAARNSVKANVARASIRKMPGEIAPEHVAVIDRIRQAYDYAYHSTPGAPHGELVTEGLMADFALAGTSAHCAGRLSSLSHLPLSSIALAVPDSADFDRGDMIARMAATVMPLTATR
ncbi:MAG: 5,10-methylenetetrahydromethanopterin reductase [Alphaproteobacteria bacterium]|nr:MAG: 5,10-methylenetetrahydromethanopterin reductase [Alphaproteobacteria bacterium]